MPLSDIADVFLQLEGPYKWYVLGAVLVVLTAVMTRVIFKTLKWFFVLVALVIIGFTIWKYFGG